MVACDGKRWQQANGAVLRCSEFDVGGYGHVASGDGFCSFFGSSAEFVGSRGGFEANDQVCPVGVEHPPPVSEKMEL